MKKAAVVTATAGSSNVNPSRAGAACAAHDGMLLLPLLQANCFKQFYSSRLKKTGFASAIRVVIIGGVRRQCQQFTPI